MQNSPSGKPLTTKVYTMATSTDEIVGFLQAEGIKFRRDEDGDVLTGFKTDVYRDRGGDLGVPILIHLVEDGEYIEVMTPRAYSCKDSPHLGTVLQALLMTSWFTKLVQFEYNWNDGEIRAIVEFPLEDAKLTQRQLMRCVRGLAQILDTYHPMITGAIERGVIELPESRKQERALHDALAANGGDRAALMGEFAAFLARRGQGRGVELED